MSDKERYKLSDPKSSSKMEIFLKKLLEEMKYIKKKLEDMDRRVKNPEITKHPLAVFNLIDQHDEGSSKDPLDTTSSHLIFRDKLSPNATLPRVC